MGAQVLCRRWVLRGAGKGRVSAVRGVEEANERVASLVVESRLPKIGAPKSDSYEGDGYVVVRHPHTDVVKSALKAVVDSIRIEYAG